MTAPNDAAWTAFMGSHEPTGQPIRQDGAPAWRMCGRPNVAIDDACPRCQRSSHWHVLQVVGETPGVPDVNDKYNPDPGQRHIPMPAQGSGVVMRCGLCGKTREYRERPATSAEVAERTAKLAQAALKP